MDRIDTLGLVLACVAAHEAAKAIRRIDHDDGERISRIANAAQPDGLHRVSGRILDAKRWVEAYQPMYGAAYWAVNEALINAYQRGVFANARDATVMLAQDMRDAAALAMRHA